MGRLPLIGRLSFHEYLALLVGCSLLALETLLRFIILLLPKPIVNWLYERSQILFDRFTSVAKKRGKTVEEAVSNAVRTAKDFGELCSYYGYAHEEHVVMTKDGYLLTLHRVPEPKGQMPAPAPANKPVVYLHHGLLMNSEVWVCLTDEERCLPFVLAEQGFDVWLGNNRGNKYSKKAVHRSPTSSKFWDYSLDDFAWHDIPDSIAYILDRTHVCSLSYIGFSQGTAQAFAALSLNPQLNQKVNVLIALAPAVSPAGLSARVVDALMKASPTSVYLFFGRKAILSSTPTWQAIFYPPIFTYIIDGALRFLFAWRGDNIASSQKIAAYAHLYSYTSVKAVVHWFQIMREAAFQMYDDDVSTGGALHGRAYRPTRFPTRNITTPVLLVYGAVDSLVDVDVMLRELPEHTRVCRLEGYEHLDILWGRNVHKDVIPEVVNALRVYCETPDSMRVGIKVFERDNAEKR
ncbi:alpha/beta-hydrolase [Paxillus ammoniavirescens]|nr:alpha/beta-hydrolase [Paxillus ammoniavirescens]